MPALLLAAGVVHAAAPPATAAGAWIEEIRFSGNDKTRPSILRQELVVREGDAVDPQRIERSRQAIMDLGLFRSVDARLEPGRAGQILEFAVHEKYYIVPLPQLDRTADGEVSYGGRLTVDNLNGLNQRLRLRYEVTSGGVTADRTVHSADLSFSYPRVAGTHYGLNLGLVRSVTPERVTDDAGSVIAERDEIANSFTIGLSRWLSREGPSQGWTVGFGTFWRYQLYERQLGAPPEHFSEKAVGLTFNIGYTRVHDYLYSRSGMEYGVVSEHGLKVAGSDTSFSRNEFYMRHYVPLGLPHEHRNLNLQLRFGGTGGAVPIDDHPYVLGGSRDLRGYEKDTITGRSFFVFNMELLAPIAGHNALRGVLFGDIGNAYADNRVLDPGDLETSLGGGLRYRVKSFVDLQLRVDISYAFGLERRKVYVGTRNTF